MTNPALLRKIMLAAWDFRRSEPSRPFADCLRGAWRYIRNTMAYAAKFMARARRAGGRVSFSPTLIRSAIGNATATARHPGFADTTAARMTSRLGR